MSAIKRYYEEKYGPNVDSWPGWWKKPRPMRVYYPTKQPNFVIVHLPNCSLAFSFETLVGVQRDNWLVAENDWGPTTGKHLNHLDNGNKDKRIPQPEVERIAHGLVTGETKALLTDLTTAHDAAVKAIQG